MTEKGSTEGDRSVSLGFADLAASVGDHIAHFYETDAEGRDLRLAFLEEGLAAGHKCVFFIGSQTSASALEEGLSSRGVDVEASRADGRLELTGGSSDPEALGALLERSLEEVPERFPLLRWGGDMTWALAEMEGSRSLMRWESTCNRVGRVPAVFLCQYRLSAFPGSVIMDAFRTHPTCIIGRSIQRNVLYQEPERFLAGMEGREETAFR